MPTRAEREKLARERKQLEARLGAEPSLGRGSSLYSENVGETGEGGKELPAATFAGQKAGQEAEEEVSDPMIDDAAAAAALADTLNDRLHDGLATDAVGGTTASTHPNEAGGENPASVPPLVLHQESQQDLSWLDDGQPEYQDPNEDSDEDVAQQNYYSLSKIEIERKLLALSEKTKEAEFKIQQNGKELLKTMNSSLQTLDNVDEKNEGVAKLTAIMNVYKKFVTTYAGTDNTVFLKMSKVFQAEYDARVTWKMELARMEEDKVKLENAHDFKLEQEVRRKKDKFSDKVARKEYNQESKRESKKRDFTELDDELLSWAGDAPRSGGKKKKTA